MDAKEISEELFKRFGELNKLFNEELATSKYVVFASTDAIEYFFDPDNIDFKRYKTGAEYAKHCLKCRYILKKLDKHDMCEFIKYIGKNQFSKLLVDASKVEEFKKHGYAKLRDAWEKMH